MVKCCLQIRCADSAVHADDLTEANKKVHAPGYAHSKYQNFLHASLEVGECSNRRSNTPKNVTTKHGHERAHTAKGKERTTRKFNVPCIHGD